MPSDSTKDKEQLWAASDSLQGLQVASPGDSGHRTGSLCSLSKRKRPLPGWKVISAPLHQKPLPLAIWQEAFFSKDALKVSEAWMGEGM